jgi:hypothetical protein
MDVRTSVNLDERGTASLLVEAGVGQQVGAVAVEWGSAGRGTGGTI